MSSIIWKGQESTTLTGLIISELPPISKPKMKTTITKIDGRDGDIIEELGYESYTKNVKIGLTSGYDINEIIKYFTGKGTLTLSNEPDKEYNAQIIDKIDYEKLLRFKTAIVKFYVQPYKYKKDEEEVVLNVITQRSLNVTNVGLEKSKPIITLHGLGTVEIKINNVGIFTYTFPESETQVVIDSMEEEAYLGTTLKNRNMQGEFPTLDVGNNTISWTGTLAKIKVKVKSRWI